MDMIKNIITEKEKNDLEKLKQDHSYNDMEYIRQKRKEYYEKNKEYIREYQRQYRSTQKSKDLRSVRNRMDYERRKQELNDNVNIKRKPGRPKVKTDEDLKKSRQEYYERNKQKLRDREKQYYEKYREERLNKKAIDPKVKERLHKYYEKNKDILKEKSKRQYMENKEIIKKHKNKTYWETKERLQELENLLKEKNTTTESTKSKNISFKIDNVEVNIKID